MIKSDSLVNLTKALIAVKKELKPLTRDTRNPFLTEKNGRDVRYADLAQVIEASDPLLSANGLVVTQFPCNDGDRVGVFTLLLHESGEFLGREFSLPLAKNDAQTGTAGVSYARRTGLKAVLGLAEVDDDGNAASGNERESKSTARPNNPPQKAQLPNESAGASSSTTKGKSQKTASAPSTTAGTPAAQDASTGKSQSSSNSQENSGSHVSVTAEEYEKYRQRFTKVVDELTTFKPGGLKAEKGAPIGHKVRAFLLEGTNQPKPEELSVAQWEDIFARVNAITNKGGLKPLVDAINAAFGGKS